MRQGLRIKIRITGQRRRSQDRNRRTGEGELGITVQGETRGQDRNCLTGEEDKYWEQWTEKKGGPDMNYWTGERGDNIGNFGEEDNGSR
jgi:hypothetical protein